MEEKGLVSRISEKYFPRSIGKHGDTNNQFCAAAIREALEEVAKKIDVFVEERKYPGSCTPIETWSAREQTAKMLAEMIRKEMAQ